MPQGIRIVGAEVEREKDAAVDELSREDHVDENMGTLSNLTGETKTLGPEELQDRAWMISDLEVCSALVLNFLQAQALCDSRSSEHSIDT